MLNERLITGSPASLLDTRTEGLRSLKKKDGLPFSRMFSFCRDDLASVSQSGVNVLDHGIPLKCLSELLGNYAWGVLLGSR